MESVSVSATAWASRAGDEPRRICRRFYEITKMAGWRAGGFETAVSVFARLRLNKCLLRSLLSAPFSFPPPPPRHRRRRRRRCPWSSSRHSCNRRSYYYYYCDWPSQLNSVCRRVQVTGTALAFCTRPVLQTGKRKSNRPV